MKAIRKFFDLEATERLLLVQAWFLLLLAELALRIIPFKHLVAFNQTRYVKRGESPVQETIPSASRLAWLVEVAGRYSVVNATCLTQALVLRWLLGRQGVTSTLQIGVARDRKTLLAHAWLEQNGQVIIGQASSEKYQTLLRT